MLNPRLDRAALSRRLLVVTAVMLLGVTLPMAAFQVAPGSALPLVGSVYDSSGAVMPGVAVTLEDAQQGTWKAETDESGRFDFSPVGPGAYTLQAAVPGFGEFRHEINLQSTRDWDRAITLQVGQLSETVSVSARRTGSAPAPTPAPLVRVGGTIRPPQRLHNVNPVFPESMRDAGRDGIVPLEAVIGVDGRVHALRVLSASVHPDFVAAAVEAVRQWRFTPTLLNGVAVDVVMTVSVRFDLE